MAAPRARSVAAAAAVVMVAAVAAACTTSGTPQSSPASTSADTIPATASVATSSIDTAKAMDPTRTAAIDAAAAQFLAESRDQTPGLWLAVWDPTSGYYEQAYGEAIIGGAKASVGDHNYIGSVTKTVLATAVLQQVAAGKLALTSTIGELDPDMASTYPSLAQVTVAQLLGMQSGVPNFADQAVDLLIADPHAQFTRDELIALAMKSPMSTPGSGTGTYADTNYLLLGRIVEKVTGRSPEDVVNDVFAQAGMTESGLPTATRPVPEPRAHGNAGPLDYKYLTDHGAPAQPERDLSGWSMAAFKENGGGYATIGDLARWGGTCMGNTLLPKDVVADRVTPQRIDLGRYGLGVFVEGTWLGHGGVVPGWNVRVACNPQTGAVVAIMANSWDAFEDMDRTLGDAVYPDYYAATRGG